MSYYAQCSAQKTNATTWASMTGLTLTIPEGVGETAIVILNVPMPYATGNSNPGGTFGVSVNGAVSTVTASFTYNEVQPPSTGRVPTTLVVGIPLGNKAQTIQAVWYGVRGSTVIIDSPATLTAIMD
jgi:hypothetical protein